MERDHNVLLERTKEAEQVAQKIEIDSIQNKMALVSWDHVMLESCDVGIMWDVVLYWFQQDHEQDVNKLKKAHKGEMIKLQHMLKVSWW